MTRRQATATVLGGGAVLMVLSVLGGMLLWVLPSSHQARRTAQAAADRALPGQVRVLDARYRFEYGSYVVTAELTAAPHQPLSWHGPRRCRPGQGCEKQILATVGDVRDGAAEQAALARAAATCALPVRADRARHDRMALADEPQTLDGHLTATVSAGRLAAEGTAGVATALDACVRGWDAQRAGLIPVGRHAATIDLVEPDGRLHATATVVVDGGRVTTSAATTLAPVLGPQDKDALRAALDAPVRAAVLPLGLGPVDTLAVTPVYAPGTTQRLAVEVAVRRTTGDLVDGNGYYRRDVFRTVVLTCDVDGAHPDGVRLVPLA